MNVHGALVALTQIAEILSTADPRRRQVRRFVVLADAQIFDASSTIRAPALVSQIGAEILQAACDLLTATLSPDMLPGEEAQKTVDRYLDLAMKRREPECQQAVARTFHRLSELRDCSTEVKR